MKYLLITLLTLFGLQLSAETLKPYCLALETSYGLDSTIQVVKKNLSLSGLDILGEYQPAKDANRWLVVIGSSELNEAVEKVGGLTGFALAQRVAFTREGNTVQVSYSHPPYWGNAYFRDDFGQVESQYKAISAKLKSTMQQSGNYIGTYFGSEKGVELDDLREYQYMFGMPEFDDTDELGEFDSYKAAVAKIEQNLAKVKDISKVYAIELEGQEIKLYGVALTGEKGESAFLPIIDISNPKHTAFLPYEFLVVGKEVHLLTGRYRIALSFPDLSMATFTKIIATPGDIEEAIEQLVE